MTQLPNLLSSHNEIGATFKTQCEFSSLYLRSAHIVSQPNSTEWFAYVSVQFSHSVVSSSLWPLDCSTAGLPVHHQLSELPQTHVHRISDSIQPSHPLSSPSPPVFNLSPHQDIFQWVSSLHQFQPQPQSFQWIFRTDFLQDWLAWSPCSPKGSQEFSPAP